MCEIPMVSIRRANDATGAMQWLLELLEELDIEYRRAHPGKRN